MENIHFIKNKTMKKIYIACPYTKKDVAVNVKKSMDMADEIINLGHAPFCPNLFHFLHMNNPHDYETWMNIDLKWLETCDYLIRVDGESPGADQEVNLAIKKKIPVFYSLEELKEYLIYAH